jgi:hypothetical protein
LVQPLLLHEALDGLAGRWGYFDHDISFLPCSRGRFLTGVIEYGN